MDRYLAAGVLATGALLLLSFAPMAGASSGGVWGIYTYGTITQQGMAGSTFVATCALSGVNQGTNGGCRITLNVVSTSGDFTCLMNAKFTGWIVEKTILGPAFVVVSGQVASSAPTTSEAQFCTLVSFPAGSVDPTTGNFVAPFNTRVPASPGEYHLFGYGRLRADTTVVVSFQSS